MTTLKRSEVVLLDEKRETCLGLIQCIKDWKSCITPETDFNTVGELSFGKNISDGVFEYWKPMAMYILSNDINDIKDGDWVFVDCRNTPTGYDGFGVWKYKKAPCPMPYWGNPNCCKKIVASTDLTLGLPQPSKSFILKYINEFNKGKIITYVYVEYYPEDKGWSELSGTFTIPETIKVALDNTITIRGIKNNYTEAELVGALKEFAKSINTVDKQVHPENYVDQFLEDNIFNYNNWKCN